MSRLRSTFRTCALAIHRAWIKTVESEAHAEDTVSYRWARTCADAWNTLSLQTMARERLQIEVSFVVDETGQGIGAVGTLRFTSDRDGTQTVFFHKGAGGTDWLYPVRPP
jgi:hypothetical protein